MNNTRGTGKTTRMVQEALRLEEEGKAVYVVVASHQKQAIKDMLPEGSSVKIETNDTLSNFDWDTMRLRGVWVACETLVDHFLIERRYHKILEMYHRFDNPIQPPKDENK